MNPKIYSDEYTLPVPTRVYEVQVLRGKQGWVPSQNAGAKDFTEFHEAVDFATAQHVGSGASSSNRLSYRVVAKQVLPLPPPEVVAVFGVTQ
jgi:hypothetical protein